MFALFIIAACGEKKSDKNLELTGNIAGLKEGKLYIKRIVDTSLITIDSIKIDGDSHFQSSIDIESPEMLYLFLDRGTSNSLDNSLMFFAEPGKMNIETDLESFYAKAKITGSKNQELYDGYKKIIARFNDDELNLTEAKFNAIKSNNQKKLDSIKALQDAIIKRKYLYAVNFAISNKDYEVAPYIVLSNISDVSFKYLDTIQKSITPKVEKSMYGKKFTTYYNERKKEEGN